MFAQSLVKIMALKISNIRSGAASYKPGNLDEFVRIHIMNVVIPSSPRPPVYRELPELIHTPSYVLKSAHADVVVTNSPSGDSRPPGRQDRHVASGRDGGASSRH